MRIAFATGTALVFATAIGAPPATALDDFRTSAILSQCVNQDIGLVRRTDFCDCFRIAQYDLTQEWVILEGLGEIGPACLLDPTVTGSVSPPNDGVVRPPIIRVVDPDWPGWVYGDQKHDHASPPSDPPGLNVPPGQRD